MRVSGVNQGREGGHREDAMSSWLPVEPLKKKVSVLSVEEIKGE